MPSPEERIVAHDALLAALAENKMTVSEAVRAMRQAMFMSIDEYAELTQVNKRYLTAIELNEGKSVSIDILEALSAPYGLALGFVRPTSRRWKADVKERQARRLKARVQAEKARRPAREAAIAKRERTLKRAAKKAG